MELKSVANLGDICVIYVILSENEGTPIDKRLNESFTSKTCFLLISIQQAVRLHVSSVNSFFMENVHIYPATICIWKLAIAHTYSRFYFTTRNILFRITLFETD